MCSAFEFVAQNTDGSANISDVVEVLRRSAVIADFLHLPLRIVTSAGVPKRTTLNDMLATIARSSSGMVSWEEFIRLFSKDPRDREIAFHRVRDESKYAFHNQTGHQHAQTGAPNDVTPANTQTEFFAPKNSSALRPTALAKSSSAAVVAAPPELCEPFICCISILTPLVTPRLSKDMQSSHTINRAIGTRPT